MMAVRLDHDYLAFVFLGYVIHPGDFLQNICSMYKHLALQRGSTYWAQELH